MRRNYILLGIILLATVLSYANSLQGEFQFDDDIYITESEAIRKPMNLFQQGILSFFSLGARPLTQLTLSLNYAIGGLNVEGYHIFNLLIHLAVVLLIYLLAVKLLFGGDAENIFGSRGNGLALAATGIFALHPLQTETVSYVIQRAESLASLFYLTGLYLLVQFVRRTDTTQWYFWLSGLVCFILGWGSKEIIVTMPVAFILVVIFFMDKTVWRKSFLAVSPFMAAIIIFIIPLVLRIKGNSVIGFEIKGLGQPDYMYTQAGVLLTYIRLILFPAGQNFDYDYPIYRQLFLPEVFVPVVFWMITVILSFCTLKIEGRWRWHFRMIGFGVLWFLAVLLPTSSLIPLRDIIFEHRVYLPIFGIIISSIAAADMIIFKAVEKFGNSVHRIAAASAIIVLVLLAALTYQRNDVWKTKAALWQDVVKKSPNKARGHNNLGNCYYLAGNFEMAIKEYELAVKFVPDFFEAYYNLAMLLERSGRREEAAYYYLMFTKEAPASYDPIKKEILGKYGLK